MRLIDTSIWLDFINKKSTAEFNTRIQTLIQSKQAAWCPMIQLELQRSTQERESALSLLGQVLMPLEINGDIWALACQIARKAYRSGKTIPNTDILIYATAHHHRYHVFHNDKHFEWLDKITGQNIAER